MEVSLCWGGPDMGNNGSGAEADSKDRDAFSYKPRDKKEHSVAAIHPMHRAALLLLLGRRGARREREREVGWLGGKTW